MCSGLWLDIKANYIKSAKIAAMRFSHTAPEPRHTWQPCAMHRLVCVDSIFDFISPIRCERRGVHAKCKLQIATSTIQFARKLKIFTMYKYKFVNMLISCNYILMRMTERKKNETRFLFASVSLTSRVMCEHICAPVFHNSVRIPIAGALHSTGREWKQNTKEE